MKKILIGFFIAIGLIATLAAVRTQNNSILISGGFGGEAKFSASQPDQIADWVNFVSNGVSVFEVPANGILPQIYGGTGSLNGSISTNTASFNTVTNDAVSGAWNLLRGQRGTFTVSIIGTAVPSGLQYSNAVSGQIRTFQGGLGDTNTITIRFQPNSMIAVTNATVIPNTTEINYE